MARNIVIFSDGTGQRGGVLVDEDRSNIYKLYRATRCGPDSAIKATEQMAFYDPGIGTLPPGSGFIGSVGRRVYNLFSQALGLGLTSNIIDCYTAIIRLYRPGDRIFLFGFSRGAYTIRCLAATLCACGIPTTKKDGKPLTYDQPTAHKIATNAVKYVYQHTSSWDLRNATPRQKQLLAQRTELAKRFRREHQTGDDEGCAVNPHFIGVFDTVASLSNPIALFGLIVLTPIVMAALSAILWWGLDFFADIKTSWWALFLGSTAVVIGLGWLWNFLSRIRVAFNLPGHPWYKTLHLTERRVNFYDRSLNPKVGFARHALALDEFRESFERVPWGEPGIWKDSDPVWFQQLWFAGNHSDIGGSYPENFSRLSDISLQWMLEAAVAVGLKYDPRYLQLNPDPSGPHHDETKSSVFKYAKKIKRRIGHDFPLHPSVLERFKAGPVLHYDEMIDYRPENLRNHNSVKQHYT